MSSSTPSKPRALRETRIAYAEPTWDIAKLYPLQGTWSESEYMSLRPSRIVEYDHGYLEIPDVPTEAHQSIVAFLYQALLAFVMARNLGKVLFAPLRIKLWEEKYREPDIVFMSTQHADRRINEYWLGADLVIEVVSEGEENRERDLVKKREDYARGGIPEYWIVDPEQSMVTVLRLEGNAYAVHGEFAPRAAATSALLDGFSVDVAAVFAAAKQ